MERATEGRLILNIGGERTFLYSLPYVSEAYLDEIYKNLLVEKDEELEEELAELIDVTAEKIEELEKRRDELKANYQKIRKYEEEIAIYLD